MPCMTQTEYGDHRGVSQATISNYIKKGKISKACIVRKKINGKYYKQIDSELADLELDKNLDQMKQRETRLGPGLKGIRPPDSLPKKMITPETVGGKGPSLHEATRIQKQYQALLAKLEYEERIGKLCPRKDFEAALKTVGRSVRDMAQGVGARVKAKVAAETDPAECERIIDLAVKQSIIDAIPEEYHEKLEVK